MCLNFWDEAWSFSSLRVFGQLSSSSLSCSLRFGRCVLRPSSCVSCRTLEPTQNFEPNPLFNVENITMKMKKLVRKLDGIKSLYVISFLFFNLWRPWVLRPTNHWCFYGVKEVFVIYKIEYLTAIWLAGVISLSKRTDYSFLSNIYFP